MKSTQLFSYIFFYCLLVVGCQSKAKEKNTIVNNNKISSIVKDSLVRHYSAQIQKQYALLQQSENPRSNTTNCIQLKGKITFENDVLLILSFDEVIQVGSYRYSQSSLLFKKTNNQLLPITPQFFFNEISNDLSEEIYYSNRIPGHFSKKIDVTGDGIDEFVFKKQYSFKDNSKEEVSIYKIDLQTNNLKQLNLQTNSTGFAYRSDALVGTNERMSFIENNKNETIIKVVQEITELNAEGNVHVKESKTNHYRYSPKSKNLMKMIMSKN